MGRRLPILGSQKCLPLTGIVFRKDLTDKPKLDKNLTLVT
jgi:hypothetical protein